MQRLKPIQNKKDIYAFDVETYQIPHDGYTEQKFLMGSVVGDGVKKLFWEQKDMANYLISRKLRGSMVFATNLEFDFEHTFKGSSFYKDITFVKRKQGGFIYAKYRHKNRKEITQFLDTWNYTGKISLKKMGVMLRIPKLPQPVCFTRKPTDQTEKEELERYNLRDSEITRAFALSMKDYCNSMNTKYKITMASVGLDYWRRNHQTIDIFQEKRNIIEKLYNGCHGGRTEVYKRGYVEDIYNWDYNSFYPSCCHDGIDGKGSFPNPNSSRHSDHITLEMIEKYEGLTNIDIICPDVYMPLLGITYTNPNEKPPSPKFIFPKGKIIGCWFTNFEIRYALTLGYEILKIHEGVFYLENFIPFRAAVKRLYSLRKKFKKDGNDVWSNMIKLQMNAGLFGKFGQKIGDKEIQHHETALEWINGVPHVKLEKMRSFMRYNERGDYVFETSKNSRIPVFVFPIIPAYTTAIARCRLHKDLLKQQENMIYTDTDSFFTTKKCFSNSSELGELKFEGFVEQAIFIKPKFYYKKEEGKEYFKVKGGIIRDMKSFNSVIDDGEKLRNQRFTSIKESGVRKLPFSSIINIDKKLGVEDNKRAWRTRFKRRIFQDSSPISVKI